MDGWRGSACLLMLVYHLLFDFVLFGWMDYAATQTLPMVLLQKYISYSFILCAGISSTMTRSNLKRGLITLAAGGVVTAVSYFVDAPIKFGVLQFLGLSMLLYAAVGKSTEKVPEKLAPILWLALFIASYILVSRVKTEAYWLFWLGFLYNGFVSYDYFPMMPYFFLFLLGSWAGGQIRKRRDTLPILRVRAPGFLTWPGSHSFLIYMIHQPVLYGGCWLVYRFL